MTAPSVVPVIPQEVQREISSLRTKLFYGFGSIAFGVKDNGFSYFLLIFYNQVVGLPAFWVGSAIAIALAVDAFVDPVIGQISDNWHSRLGRRHPFMYGAAVPVAIGYWFVWNPPAGWSQNALFYYLIAIAIAVRSVIAVYEIPSTALVAELTPDYDQRTSFFSYRFLFGWLGGLAMQLLAYGVFLVPSLHYRVGLQNPVGYSRYGLTASLMMVAAIVISAAGTQKFVRYFVTVPRRSVPFRQVLKEMGESLNHRSFIVLSISALFSSVAAGTLAALNNYFNVFFWGLSSGQIFLLSLTVVASPIVAIFVSTPLSRAIGKKRAAIAFWISSTVFGWIPMGARLLDLFPRNGAPVLMPLLIFFTTIATMLSISSSVTISSMLADVVEDSQRKTGRRSEGLFFSANSFILKAISGSGALMAGVLLALAHFPAKANPATLDPEIPRQLALFYMPSVFALYAIALVCLSFYRIDRGTHEENLRVLAEAAARSAPGDVT
ncbi:MAG TPA: MFS transporter [Rhizomicrobium sp.]|nr:MFS transporter [Rhizomicrobium sp.]